MLADRMKDERDLSRIADCAYTEALLHPGWSVETVLPPLPVVKRVPGWNTGPMSIFSASTGTRRS